MQPTKKFNAIIYEYERGWGSRVDEIRPFDTKEERDQFVVEFNAQNTSPTVPDWYMVAEAGTD